MYNKMQIIEVKRLRAFSLMVYLDHVWFQASSPDDDAFSAKIDTCERHFFSPAMLTMTVWLIAITMESYLLFYVFFTTIN